MRMKVETVKKSIQTQTEFMISIVGEQFGDAG